MCSHELSSLEINLNYCEKRMEITEGSFDYDPVSWKAVSRMKWRLCRLVFDYYAQTYGNPTSLVWLRFGLMISWYAVENRLCGRPWHHNSTLWAPSRPCRKTLIRRFWLQVGYVAQDGWLITCLQHLEILVSCCMRTWADQIILWWTWELELLDL